MSKSTTGLSVALDRKTPNTFQFYTVVVPCHNAMFYMDIAECLSEVSVYMQHTEKRDK